jgi:hypothetical protein
MRIKYFFLFVIFLLFQSLAKQLVANSDIDRIPFNEGAGRSAERRYTVKDVEARELRHNDRSTLIQHSLKGRTFLRYNVSAGNYSCLFHSIQHDRTVINRLIQAVETDHPRAQLIVDNLRSAILEKLATDDLNPDWARLTDPNAKITKAEVRGFLTPFARNGEFAPYEVALAFGALEGMKVHVWQDPDPNNRTKKLTLRGCTVGDFPGNLHIFYSLNSRLVAQGERRARGNEHFERLVLEGETDREFEQAKSLSIEKRIGTPLSSFLNDAEIGHLRKKFPKPEVARTVAPQPQERQAVTPQPVVTPKSDPQPQERQAVTPQPVVAPKSDPQPQEKKTVTSKPIEAVKDGPKPRPQELEPKKVVSTKPVKPVTPPLQRATALAAQPRTNVSIPPRPVPVSRSIQQAPSSQTQQRNPAILLPRKAPIAPPTVHTSRTSSRVPANNLVRPSVQPNRVSRTMTPPPARRASPIASPSATRLVRSSIQPNRVNRTVTPPPARRASPVAPLQVRPLVQLNRAARTVTPPPARRASPITSPATRQGRPAIQPNRVLRATPTPTRRTVQQAPVVGLRRPVLPPTRGRAG